MVGRFRRSKVSRFEFLDKFGKAIGLLFQAVTQFGVFDFARSIKKILDLRQKTRTGKMYALR